MDPLYSCRSGTHPARRTRPCRKENRRSARKPAQSMLRRRRRRPPSPPRRAASLLSRSAPVLSSGRLGERRLLEQRPERLRLEQAAPHARRPSSSSAKTARASGVQAASPRAPLLGERRRAARRSARRCRRSGARRAAARRCRSSGSPAAGRRRRSGRGGGSGRAASRSRTRSPSRRRAPRWRTRKRRCLPSPTVSSPVELALLDQQRHAGVAEPERREPRELLAERQPELAARDDRVDRDRRPRGRRRSSTASACAANASRERLDVLGPDREPGGGAVAAEALEVLGAGARAPPCRSNEPPARPEPFQSPPPPPAISTTGRP